MPKKKASAVLVEMKTTHTANGFNISANTKKIFIINPVMDTVDEFGGNLQEAISYCNSLHNPLEV